ncbi:hypothetical protein HK18_10540 [Commensalibacter intestini]|uniref:Uncharacterized protein n=1 Tax=Commensalibacter intestini TaxID=479936 RepID=A0A251ZUU5_9PROT|nr:hypothetical protein [Commensalibacter intestini]OUI78448.1 hypothetical protein HK18_10540 [Commensalibacter intestini]
MREKIIIILVILLSLNQTIKVYAQLKSSEIIQGPFKIDLYPDGKIYIEQNNDEISTGGCPTTLLILEYQKNNQIKKETIDEYYEDGACVKIASIFFSKIHNKEYVFVMQKWEQNMPAINIYDNSYDTIAYTKNKDGKLCIDLNISKDHNLSEIDGTVADGKKVHYKYKTAAVIKKYLEQKYQ